MPRLDGDEPVYSPVCMRCTHLTAVGDRLCDAYPGPDRPIPLDIWRGDDPHTAPRPGDQGITFSPRTPEQEPPRA